MTPEQREELSRLLFEFRMDEQNRTDCRASERAIVAFVDSLAGTPEPPKVPGLYRLSLEVDVFDWNGRLSWTTLHWEGSAVNGVTNGLWWGPIEES